jgi:pyruvate formate lyase activating enzyme
MPHLRGTPMHKALFYQKDNKGSVRCLLCPQRCRIEEGAAGLCGARRVVDGELYSANYGLCAAAHWDPVEKKPLYHFYPGRPILSLGTLGCNLDCRFCQNWTLARGNPESHVGGRDLTPGRVLEMLQREGSPDKVLGVAYTYNEPTVWYEFVFDTASLLHEHGYRNVMVTNGFISREALEELLPLMDAFNIDVKAFSDSFYREYCRGMRRPVLEAVELAASASHVEITCLLIPTLNDDPVELELLCDWLAGINPDIPLHFSRYFPQYQLDLPPTPVETLQQAREIALRKLNYVYLGNVELPGAADTCCPRCGATLVRRRGYQTFLDGLAGPLCRNCRTAIRIILP